MSVDYFVVSGPSPRSTVNITSGVQQEILVDESDSSNTYIGYAATKSLQADAVWQIKRISFSSGVTTVSFADGNANFDNVWNNRTAYSYS